MEGKWIELTGSSMSPYLISGDKIFIRKDLTPRLGDIVLFSHEGNLIIHRFIGEDFYKGDNLKRFDQEYEKSYQFEGVATHRMLGNKSLPLSEGNLVRFLSLLSGLNHANLALFHRIFHLGVSWIGRLLRFKENTWGIYE